MTRVDLIAVKTRPNGIEANRVKYSLGCEGGGGERNGERTKNAKRLSFSPFPPPPPHSK
jgi:hypothetical protein